MSLTQMTVEERAKLLQENPAEYARLAEELVARNKTVHYVNGKRVEVDANAGVSWRNGVQVK